VKRKSLAEDSTQNKSTSALSNKHIVNTRAVHQAIVLDKLIHARGGISLPYPCIAIVPPDDTTLLDAALQDAVNGKYEWVVFTSSNTVYSVAERLEALALDKSIASAKIAVIGPATQVATQNRLNRAADIVADEHIAESLAKAVNPLPNTKILLPQSTIARPTLAQQLTASGASVTTVGAYRNVIGSGGITLHAQLQQHNIDAVTFTSSSTFENLLIRLRDEGGDIDELRQVCLAAIGPKTADTIQAHGFTAHVIAQEYTLEGLVDTLEDYFRKERSHAH